MYVLFVCVCVSVRVYVVSDFAVLHGILCVRA